MLALPATLLLGMEVSAPIGLGYVLGEVAREQALSLPYDVASCAGQALGKPLLVGELRLENRLVAGTGTTPGSVSIIIQ